MEATINSITKPQLCKAWTIKISWKLRKYFWKIKFENLSVDANSAIWIFGNGDTSNYLSPTYKYTENNPGSYTVTLIALSEYGCADTSRQEITIKEIGTIFIPSAFTPDDDGINDIFIPKGNNIDSNYYKMLIYDRWGEKVFETNDLSQGWDGRVKNENMASPGIYKWYIIYRDKSGTEYTKSGNLTLIR